MTRPSSVLHVLYVCDFASIHARELIEAVSQLPNIEVKVLTSRAAAPMAGVRIWPLFDHPGRPRPAWLLAIADRSRAALEQWPWLLRRAWAREVSREADLIVARLVRLPSDEKPDIIHALRLLPEGIAVLALSERWPDAPLVASVWGQDLIFFARATSMLRKRTIKLMKRLDVLLPDTMRDAILARDEFGLRAAAHIRVIAGPGGLDISRLQRQMLADPPSAIGQPAITCFRAWTADTFGATYLLNAMAQLLTTHPAAHLYLIAPDRPRRLALVQRQVTALGLERAVTLRIGHAPHGEVMAQMQASDINVLIGATDGLPMTMLESMFWGQVQVALNRSCYIPPLADGTNAALFDSIDAAAIARALRRAIELVPRRAEISRENRTLLSIDYAREGGISDVVALYRGAAASKQRVSS
jgi:glycosyltransferase involved in cell wall biosynthesis